MGFGVQPPKSAGIMRASFVHEKLGCRPGVRKSCRRVLVAPSNPVDTIGPRGLVAWEILKNEKPKPTHTDLSQRPGLDSCKLQLVLFDYDFWPQEAPSFLYLLPAGSANFERPFQGWSTRPLMLLLLSLGPISRPALTFSSSRRARKKGGGGLTPFRAGAGAHSSGSIPLQPRQTQFLRLL